MAKVDRARWGLSAGRAPILAVAIALFASACSSSTPAETSTTTTTAAPTTTTTTKPAPTTTAAPTTTTTTSPTEDPDALAAAITAAMAAQTTFLVDGSVFLMENFGDSEESFASVIFRGGQDPARNHWVDQALFFDAEQFEGTFDIEIRVIDGIEYSQDPQTGEWSGEEPDGDFDAIDALLAGELVLADTTAEELPGGYVVTGTVPADPSIEQVVLEARKSDMLVEFFTVRTAKPRSDFAGLIPAEGPDVFENETWNFGAYGTDVVLLETPPEGLATSSVELRDGLFSLQVPLDWEQATQQDILDAGLPADEAWVTADGLIMMASTENLLDAGFGELTLEEYVNFVVMFVLGETVVLDEIIDTSTAQGFPQTTIVGRLDETDLLPFMRSFYLHDSVIGVSIVVFAPRQVFEDNLDTFDFVINTLLVTEPDPAG